MKIGYARVSKLEQCLESQLKSLKEAGCDKIFQDKLTGSTIERPGLEKILEFIREGDTLIVTRLDRLGRSTKHLIEVVTSFQERGVHFQSLAEDINTNSATGKLIFHLFCSIAEFERNLISERTKKGLETARLRGRMGGRKKKLDAEQEKALKKLYDDRELSVDALAKTFKVSIPTLYKYLRN